MLRENILGIHKTSNSYRLVHGEGDGLSGLIIDKFADVFVVEPYSAGYIGIIAWIASSLKSLYHGCSVIVRPDERTATKEGVDFSKTAKDYSGSDFVEIKENQLCISKSKNRTQDRILSRPTRESPYTFAILSRQGSTRLFLLYRRVCHFCYACRR